MPQSPESPPMNGDNSAPVGKTIADRYLTSAEVSERLRNRISVKTLANWRCPSSRYLGPPFIRAGGRILYLLDEFEEWEVQRKSQSGRNPPRPKVEFRVPPKANLPPVHKQRKSKKAKLADLTQINSDDAAESPSLSRRDTMYKIERGIALPRARSRVGKSKKLYPFAKMQVDDSFMVPIQTGQTMAGLQRHLSSSAVWMTGNQRMKFATRAVRKGDVYRIDGVAHEEKIDGVRVWRIE
jgi:hypothetical protein